MSICIAEGHVTTHVSVSRFPTTYVPSLLELVPSSEPQTKAKTHTKPSNLLASYRTSANRRQEASESTHDPSRHFQSEIPLDSKTSFPPLHPILYRPYDASLAPPDSQ
jgi:hypothetical protein